MSTAEELNPSNIGTKSFWEDEYKMEMNNFKDHGDTGEVWFGEEIMSLVVNWICDKVDKNSSILDIGCGNGLLLMDLAKKGYTNLTGIDYSETAIALANEVAKTEKAKIHFEVCDVISDMEAKPLKKKYKVLLDKGTYDTVSLSPEDAHGKREKYVQNSAQLLEDGGIFLIATCNWTDEEIKEHMAKHFEVQEILPTPIIEFAGKKGHNVSVIVFKKK